MPASEDVQPPYMRLLSRRRGALLNVSLVVVLLAATTFAGWTYLRRDDAAAANASTTTATATRSDVESTVSASGTAAPALSRSASFGADGTVSELRVDLGDKVEKGQVLARATSGSARLQLRAARATYDISYTSYADALDAQSEASDTSDTADDDAADSAVASAYSALLQTKVALRQAKASVDGLTLRAPITGTVVSLSGDVGDATGGSGDSSSGSGFATVARTSSFVVTGEFSETDTADLEVGQRATVTFNALPNRTFKGTVTSIDLTSTTTDNVVSYGVDVRIPNPPRRLRSGQTGTISVVTDRASNVVAVPTAAVSTVNGVSTVQRVVGDTEVTTTVETGVEGGGYVEITSGLSEGEDVVIELDTSASGSGFPDGGFPGGEIVRKAPTGGAAPGVAP
jgi:macrolide-specific efflux system membrane fusion protein